MATINKGSVLSKINNYLDNNKALIKNSKASLLRIEDEFKKEVTDAGRALKFVLEAEVDTNGQISEGVSNAIKAGTRVYDGEIDSKIDTKTGRVKLIGYGGITMPDDLLSRPSLNGHDTLNNLAVLADEGAYIKTRFKGFWKSHGIKTWNKLYFPTTNFIETVAIDFDTYYRDTYHIKYVTYNK